MIFEGMQDAEHFVLTEASFLHQLRQCHGLAAIQQYFHDQNGVFQHSHRIIVHLLIELPPPKPET
jgi:hypothetical protein